MPVTLPTAAASNRKSTSRGNSLQTVFHAIRDLIVRGRLSPGTWIIEIELASRLGFSRTPVRGALQLLQREGLVVAAGKGVKSRMMVAPLTQEDSQELYEIIGHLEGLAARLTTRLTPTKRTNLVEKLKEINAAIAELVDTRCVEPDRIFDLDLSFHSEIMKASAGPRLLELHRSAQPQAERYWRLYTSAVVDELHTSVEEHNDIIRAISESDADAAEKGLQLNWENGAARLAEVIARIGERGSW